MRLSQFALSFGFAALFTTGCESNFEARERELLLHVNAGTMEVARLDSAIDGYEATPSRARAANVTAALARLAAATAVVAGDLRRSAGAQSATAEAELDELRQSLDLAEARYTEIQAAIARKQAKYAVSIGGEKK